MSTVLKCQVDKKGRATWDGPEFVKYADENDINPDLSNKENLEIVGNITNGEYNLAIHNVSKNEEGLYKCYQINNQKNTANETFVTLTILVKPKNVTIDGTINGQICGQENVLLQLKCAVISGNPKETITWYNMSSNIETGGPESLIAAITPTRFDHRKQYTCRVNSTALQEPLEETVTLDIKYAPIMVFINTNPTRTNEGKNLTTACTYDSNPAASVVIQKENNVIRTLCDKSTCSHTFSNVSRNDSGLYKCIGRNTYGSGHANITVVVQYPPDIHISQNGKKKVLTCQPKGIPPIYTYRKWQHLSEYGKRIRWLPAGATVEMESQDENIDNYQMNGIYICSAENGILNAHGSVVQSGKYSVLLKDKPKFVYSTEHIQYGRFSFPINISVSVYCYPEFNSWNVSSEDYCCYNETNFGHVTDSNVTVRIFDAAIQMKVFKMSLTTLMIKEEHFTTYTFWIKNEIGYSSFKVKLISSDRPETPNITEIIPGMNSLQIKFVRNYNGGLEQQFLLSYRKLTDKKWRISGPINDTFEQYYVHMITDLDDETYYELRLYASNAIGTSNFTSAWIVRTLDAEIKLNVLLSVLGALLGCLVIAISAFYVFWCHKKDEMAVENYIYQSQGNFLSNQSDHQRDLRERSLLLHGNGNITTGLGNINSVPNALNTDFQHQRSAGIDSIVETQDIHDLNYVEVAFGPSNSNNTSFIHGINDRTIYSDIDTTAFFESSQETQDNSSRDSSEDDFMYVDGIVHYTKRS
ncbi:unnamed protein product [Mytilus coruscus]|uniref:NCAM n=1 Tax=Mytilus coruscus TaxID=42192 RepID=A0A6J8BK49_MYTCO|nr:unnamed protein product [Mytilus coruscus]